MRHRSTQFLLRDDLVGNGLHHIRAGDEHVGAVLHHEDEVGHGGGIDGAARARPHDQRNLRDDARRQHVALEHLGIAAERRDALLDARAARIVEADHGRADLHRHVHDLADLLRVPLAERAAEHGEILAEEEHQPAVDRARSGDDAIAGNGLVRHAEIDAIMLDIHVELLERSLVEQDLDPLARGELALGVLRSDALLAATHPGGLAPALKLLDRRRHGVLRVQGRSLFQAAGAFCKCEFAKLRSRVCEVSVLLKSLP